MQKQKNITINTYAKMISGDCFFLYLPGSKQYHKGDYLQVKGRFMLPEVARNTGGFSYRRYCNAQNIYGSVFVEDFYCTQIASFYLIYAIQDAMEQSFARLFPANEMGLVLGMTIGDTNALSEEVLENFQTTGITHLVAVSGSNVMYVLVCVQFLFGKILGRRKTHYVSMGVLFIFMLVSGASSSVIRATIMASMMLLAEIFYQHSDSLSNLFFAAIILMLCNPLAVFDVGFVLSFAGTFGIISLAKDFKEKMACFGKLAETLAVTCSAQIILLPVMAYYFHTISPISLLINLIVVPLSGTITILGFLVFLLSCLIFPLAQLIAKPLYVMAHFTIGIADFFAKIPYATLRMVTPTIFEILFFYFMIFYATGKIRLPFYKQKGKWITYPQISKRKVIAFLMAVWMCLEVFFAFFPRQTLEVHFMDVGQGDAMLIQTCHHQNILVDGGGSETYDVGENVLMPYLLTKRVLSFEAIFSSHSDADHLNGILTVMQNCHVKRIYVAKNARGYETLETLAKEKGIEIVTVEEGNQIWIDGVCFEVVGPPRNISPEDVNAYSLVLKMSYAGRSILFTGDMNQEAELKMKKVSADILKVAHHGSNTSSAHRFLAQVKPSIAIIQVGKNNRYGHPHAEVLDRLEQYATVYTTAEKGEITLMIEKNGKIKMKFCIGN